MMRLLTTAIVSLGIIGLLPLQESEVPIKFDGKIHRGPSSLASYVQQKQFVTRLPAEVAPIWTADQTNPPVSAAEAIRLAITKSKEYLPDDNDSYWLFESATLVPRDAKTGYWYWLVTFDLGRYTGRAIGRGVDFRMVVLMDGTVVEPTINDRRR